MPRDYRVRPLSRVRAAQIAALAAALFPSVLSAQQARPYDDPSTYAAPYDDQARTGNWSDTIPGHLAIVDGEAWLERDGDVERADENVALLAGDRIRTSSGRVEVLFADGSVLDIDRATTVAFLSESLLGLERGQVRLTLARASSSIDYRVDGAGATALIQAAGEYRVAVVGAGPADAELRLTVIRGMAELASPHGRTAVRTGYEAVTTAQTIPSLPYTVSVALTDPFDRWAYEQRAARVGATSAQYLPEPIYAYSGVLDRHGDWHYERPYGYVWYPRVVSTWRPYHDGRWSFAASFGWIWVGGSRWSWPTHHYGRWGYRTNRWFWIPDRRWGPAWVSWAHAPGYVSWCPLGFDNRPVISITNITIFDSHVRRGWTVLPSRTFVRNVVVRQHALPVQTVIPAGTRFAVARTPSAPASFVRTAAARRPLGAPTVVQSASSRDRGLDRVTTAQPAPGRTAASRTAPGTVRAPVDSSRQPARAAASRAGRSIESAPVDAGRQPATSSRSAAARRAPAPTQLATDEPNRADRTTAVTPSRAVRSMTPSRAVDDGPRAESPATDRAPRRAVPSRSGAVPDAPAERVERGPQDQPAPTWSAPARRAPAGRSAPAPVDRGDDPGPAPVSRARSRSGAGAPPPAPVDRPDPPAAPVSRGRSRSMDAPSAPPPPPERAVRPSAPANEGGSRSRSADRPAPSDSGESQGRRRAAPRR